MRVCLLGAGASNGYGKTDEKCLSEFMCPPLTKWIIQRGIRIGLLTNDSFPILYESLQIKLDTEENLDRLSDQELEIDMEDFLVWTINNSKGELNLEMIDRPSEKRLFDPTYEELILGHTVKETYDFLYEFFRLFTILYSPELFPNDNYLRLIRQFNKNT